MGTIKLNKNDINQVDKAANGVECSPIALIAPQIVVGKNAANVKLYNLITKFDENSGWTETTESEYRVAVGYGVYEDEFEEGLIEYDISPSLVDGTITNIVLKLYCSVGSGQVDIGNKIYNVQSGTYIEIDKGTKLKDQILLSRVNDEYVSMCFDFESITISYLSDEKEEENVPVSEDKERNIKAVDLTDRAKGYIDIMDGTFCASFKSYDFGDFALPLSICHFHNMGGGSDHCGTNWRLNIDRKLVASSADIQHKTIYIYTDEFGKNNELEENYYYTANGTQKFISKDMVTVDLNGELFYDGNNVYKHQSCKGLTLISKISDFINSEYLEQRTDTQIQLEEYLNQVKATLINYVRSTNKGIYSSSLGILTKTNYEILFDGIADSSDIIITEAEALQLQALNREYEKDNNEVVNKQIIYIIKQARANLPLIKDAFIKYFAKQAELELLKKQTPVNYLRDNDGVISGFNENGDLVLMCDTYGNYVMIVYDANNRISEIYDSNKKTAKFEYVNNLLSSITDCRGRTVKYTYSGNKLIRVTYPDEETLDFEYSSGYMRSVKSNQGTQAVITRESGTNRTTKIVNKVSDSSGTKENKVTIGYGNLTTTFTYSDGNTESYTFNSNNEITRYKTQDVAQIYVEETFTYEKVGEAGKQVSCKHISNVAPTEKTTKIYDELGRLIRLESDWKYVTDYMDVRSITDYKYDLNGNLIYEETCVDYKDEDYATTNEFTEHSYTTITNYSYNAQGSLVLTESYVIGEEETTGKNFAERVYDDNGNVVKTIRWNSLDSSSKFYTEAVAAENGQITADKDETGEVYVEYEYVDGTSVVNSVKYPNGSKLAYGRNPYNFAVTSVTQSTEDGEANTTDMEYCRGLPKRVKSGNTVIDYDYDGDGHRTSVELNGNLQYTAKYNLKYEYNGDYETCDFGYVTETYYSDSGNITVKTERSGMIDEDTGTCNTSERVTVNKTKIYEKTCNGLGNVTRLQNGNLIVDYSYAWGNDLTKIQSYINGTLTLTEDYTFDNYKLLTQKTLSGAVTQTYTYAYKDNAARDLDSIGVAGYTFKPLKDVNGRNTGREILNGTNKVAAEYITYRKIGDHATNMPATVWFGNGPQIKDSVKYKYDRCGNISEITENGHVTSKYTYDGLNRLIREDNRAIGKTILFAYDNAGNITERCEYEYTRKSGEELTELVCEHFSYDYEGDRLKCYNGETFEYDNLGYPTTYRGKPATWQYGKLLTSYNGVTFTYNGFGSRASKGSINFIYDSDGRLVKQSNGLEFIYDASGVAGVKYGGKQYFYRKDAQGNIVAILDSNGELVVKYVYDAWGNHAVLDKDGNDVRSGIGVHNPFRYRGYYYDTETELYYLQSRYYDPELGRFISQDGLEYADPETVNGLNLYAYCGNNPVMNVDPTGSAWWNWLIIGIEAVAGIVACVIPGGQALGISLLAGAAVGAACQFAAPAIAQAVGGFASMANGVSAFSTGVSLLGAGPAGIAGGVALMLVGVATVAFGANEMVAAAKGINHIQRWTGMSDTAYGLTYAGLNLAAALGQTAGNIYRLHATREVRFGYNHNIKGYRYKDQTGKALFDFDFPHGNINSYHFHGIPKGDLSLRTKGHWNYIRLLIWMLIGR